MNYVWNNATEIALENEGEDDVKQDSWPRGF